jgi:hypothetical protein
MKPPLFLSLICALVFPAVLHAEWNEYQIESVDAGKSELTLKDSTLKEVTLQVLPGADITLNGTPASLGDLQAPMKVKVTMAGPGEVQSIQAEAVAKPEAAAMPSVDAAPDPSSMDDQAGKVVKANIVAKSPNAFTIHNVRKGMKIDFHYISGMWKSFGAIPTDDPDDAGAVEGDKCRLAIALPGRGRSAGEAIAVVPPGTKIRGFVFEAQQDYPALVLRINDTKFKGPGEVLYDLHITPPQD